MFEGFKGKIALLKVQKSLNDNRIWSNDIVESLESPLTDLFKEEEIQAAVNDFSNKI